MDLFNKCVMEGDIQGTAECDGGDLVGCNNREKKKLDNGTSSTHGKHDACREQQSVNQGPETATEHNNIGQAPDACSGLHPHVHATLQGRLEDRDSSIPGLHKGMEQDVEELPNGSTQLVSNPLSLIHI